MDLCLVEEQCLGTRVLERWWEKECMDMQGMRKADKAAKPEDSKGGEDGKETEMQYYTRGYCRNYNTLGKEPVLPWPMLWVWNNTTLL